MAACICRVETLGVADTDRDCSPAAALSGAWGVDLGLTSSSQTSIGLVS
jgi:hypothetical protein